MKIVAALLLVSCTAANSAYTAPDIQVKAPIELLGKWCSDDICLEVTESGYSDDWVIYKWSSAFCTESWFMHIDSQSRLMMGVPFPSNVDCFSHLSSDGQYEGKFSLRDNQLTALLSVTDSPVVLTEQQENL